MARHRSRSRRTFQTALCLAVSAAGRGWAAAEPAAETLPWNTLLVGAGFLGVVLLGALAWLASLRSQVRKTQAALAETEMRFRTAFRTSPDSININRLEDGLYEDINEGFTEITGYTAGEVIGRTSLEIDIWADPGDRTRLVEGLRREGVVRNLEARFRMKGGRVIRGLISARVIDFGGIPHILSVARNIEDWAQAQEAQRESEARLRSVIESMPFEFFVFDPSGRCSTVNSKARGQWGDAVGRLVGEIPGDAQIAARWEEGFHRALTGETLEDDWEWSGGERPAVYHSMIAPITGPDGIVGVQALNVDVTERQELEEQLSQAQKMEAVGTLASGVAHDFNNLLQGILGFTELAAQEPDLPDQARDHLGKIGSAAQSAAELVRSLLTYGRRENPKLDPLDLNQQVETVVTLLRRTIPKMISIETRLAQDLEPCQGDTRQLEQVLLNLGTNARDAMPDGGRLLFETATVALVDGTQDGRSGPPAGRYVRCTVTDTGAGMDEATTLRIFDPFFTTKRVGEGTGLGLSTAYGVAKNHGGYLTCDSTPGEGTRFALYLPVQAGGPSEAPVHREKEGPAPRGEGTLLVVDDEEFVRDFAGTALEALGYTVWRAESGEQALELFEKHGGAFDLVLLDLGMPGMGGRQCLAHLRELAPELPVLVASGYDRTAQPHGIREAGAAGFLSKPYSLDTLARQVAKCLGNRA